MDELQWKELITCTPHKQAVLCGHALDGLGLEQASGGHASCSRVRTAALLDAVQQLLTKTVAIPARNAGTSAKRQSNAGLLKD